MTMTTRFEAKSTGATRMRRPRSSVCLTGLKAVQVVGGDDTSDEGHITTFGRSHVWPQRGREPLERGTC